MTADETEKRILGSIKLAADSLCVLRRMDVYRVLSDANQQGLLTETAEYIRIARPELTDEIRSCIEDLKDEALVGPPNINQIQVF